jgi:hypothetical protein
MNLLLSEATEIVKAETLGRNSGIDKMRERASAARRHLLNFCRHVLKYWHFNNI